MDVTAFLEEKLKEPKFKPGEVHPGWKFGENEDISKGKENLKTLAELDEEDKKKKKPWDEKLLVGSVGRQDRISMYFWFNAQRFIF